MKYLLSVLFTLLVFSLVSPSEAAKRYGLIIGHNLGFHGEPSLDYAEDDAVRFADVLTAIGGVDKRDLVLLAHPTRAEVMAGFEKLTARISAVPGAVVFFYFAGHGDEASLHLAGERFDRSEVMTAMKRLSARTRLAIIDACQTPSMTQQRGVKAGRSFDIGVLGPGTPEGVVVIHSSEKGEPALESRELQGALFTHHLVSGLRGAADADRDGRITLNEAYAHARRLTVIDSATASDIVQTPSFAMDLSGADELVLTETTRSRALLVLPRGGGVRYVVLAQTTGNVVAEVEGDPQKTQTIAVPAGRLLVQRRVAERSTIAGVDTPFGGVRVLKAKDFVSQPYDLLAQRGGPRELWPHLLGAFVLGKMDFVDSEPIWRLGPGLRYEHHSRAVVLGLSAEAGFSTYRNALYDTTEQVIIVSGDLGWRKRLTWIALSLVLGPYGQLTFQQRRRLDAARLNAAGLEDYAGVESLALGLGGRLRVLAALPLRERVELQLGLDAALFGQRISSLGTSVEPIVSCGASLGFGFRL
ncbi:MAG: caspase family protein [Myxococcota bacterium]|jgi:hypothetical protein|nr:caspase family protein [Myxococcota bacterium]